MKHLSLGWFSETIEQMRRRARLKIGVMLASKIPHWIPTEELPAILLLCWREGKLRDYNPSKDYYEYKNLSGETIGWCAMEVPESGRKEFENKLYKLMMRRIEG